MVERGSTRPRDRVRRPVAGTAGEAVALRLPVQRAEPATGSVPTVPLLHVAPWRSVDETAELFGTCGDAARCWCAFDRLSDARFETLTPDECRALLAVELAVPGPAPGLIATLGGQRVGWCSVAPRSRFPRLALCRSTTSPQTAGDDPDVWSVTCFVVRPGFRRRGTAGALLDAAIRYARTKGAGWLEGYPSDTAGRHPTASGLYRGTLSLFTTAGFEVVARPRPGWAIVRLEL